MDTKRNMFIWGLRSSWMFRSIDLLLDRLRLKCDDTHAETRFRLSAKRASPFKSVGASVLSTTGSRSVRISGSNAGYTVFRGSVKNTGYPLHSPVPPSLPFPCVTLCYHVSTGLYQHFGQSISTWKIGPIGCPEMTVPNYQPTPRNIAKGWRCDLHRGGSLKVSIRLFDSEKWIVWIKWYAKSVWWNANGTEPSRVLSFRNSRVYANDYYLLLLVQNSVKGKLPLKSTGSITTPTMNMNDEAFVSLNRERSLKVLRTYLLPLQLSEL